MANFIAKEINDNLRIDPLDFVADCCHAYVEKAEATAFRILKPGKKILMLAGPSASGKTTTAKLLSQWVEKQGGKAVIVSLDDFYLPDLSQYPLDSKGNPDFETVEALDLPLMEQCFLQLIEKGECRLPIFDFETHARSKEENRVDLGKDGVLIVEGLHALNPLITRNLPDEAMAKLYVSVSSRVYDEDGNRLLGRRDLRLLRRTMRDVRYRSFSAVDTFGRWDSVAAGENRYLFPYEVFADEKLDSFHPCEPCLAAGEAVGLLKETAGTPFEKKAERLIQSLSAFTPMQGEDLPEVSLLHEFLG